MESVQVVLIYENQIASLDVVNLFTMVSVDEVLLVVQNSLKSDLSLDVQPSW